MAKTNCKHVWKSYIEGAACAECRYKRPGQTSAVNMVPRNDMALVRIVDIGQARGIAMPEVSIQGKEFIVVAVGPKVEKLESGDKVLMIGNVGDNYYPLPDCKDLIVIKETNCVLVTGKADHLTLWHEGDVSVN